MKAASDVVGHGGKLTRRPSTRTTTMTQRPMAPHAPGESQSNLGGQAPLDDLLGTYPTCGRGPKRVVGAGAGDGESRRR